MQNKVFTCDGIDHVVLRVTDIERSLVFYTQILGFRLERVVTGMEMYQVRAGRNLIDLVLLDPSKQLADPAVRGIDHVCLSIKGDMADVVPYLKEHDVPITFGPIELYGATGFGTSIYITDPDDHTIELKTDHIDFPIKHSVDDFKTSLSRFQQQPASQT